MEHLFAIMTTLRDRFFQRLRRAGLAVELLRVPRLGMWTTVGLTRGQFFAMLLLSILLFLLLDGPAWHHLHDSHTRRILGSYGVSSSAVRILRRYKGLPLEAP
jgi:hypothetical protein